MSGGDHIAPGWYPHPTDPSREQWWDGASWTTLDRPVGLDAAFDRSAAPHDEITQRVPASDVSAGRPGVVAPVSHPGAPRTHSVPPDAEERRSVRVPVPVILMAGVVVALATAVGIVAIWPDDEEAVVRDRVDLPTTTAAASTTAATSAPVSSSTVATTTTGAFPSTTTTGAFPTTTAGGFPTTTPGSVAGRVARTCGAAGTGDCFVAVRVGPTSTTAEVGRLDEGSEVLVACQTHGESVRSSILGDPTDIWVRDTAGRYMSAAFVEVAGWSPFTITTPC